MSIRREPTYLSTDVWKCCWLLAKARSAECDDQGLTRVTTADEIADTILRTAIFEKHPQLFEHQKAVTKLEKELLKTL